MLGLRDTPRLLKRLVLDHAVFDDGIQGERRTCRSESGARIGQAGLSGRCLGTENGVIDSARVLLVHVGCGLLRDGIQITHGEFLSKGGKTEAVKSLDTRSIVAYATAVQEPMPLLTVKL